MMPPELQTALTKPEVITALVTALVLILGVVGTAAMLIKAKLDKALAAIKDDTQATRYQAENAHGPNGKDVNLRDQVDRIEAVVVRLDETVSVVVGQISKAHDKIDATGRKIDHAMGEVHDRIQAEAEDRRSDVKMVHQRITELRSPRPGP